MFDLFSYLDATEAQLDFPVLYASGRQGWADKSLDGPRKVLSENQHQQLDASQRNNTKLDA